MIRNRPFQFFLILLCIFAFAGSASIAHGQGLSVEELRAQIEAKRKEKEAIEEENRRLEAQIQSKNQEAKTLQQAVNELDTTQKKLQNDLRVTENKIDTTELSIQKIELEIDDKEQRIRHNKAAIAETLRILYQTDSSLIESMLRYKNINELWDSVETIRQFQSVIQENSVELADLKVELQGKKQERESEKRNLEGLKGELGDRKVIVDQNKQAKNTLLTKTKSEEAEYKRMLAENIERGKKFEQELFAFESQLQAQIDKSKLPSVRSGVLQWPLDNVFVTQQFGRTADSGRLYVSGTHNGVDFRASVGTPVKAVAAGVVDGIGNTDSQAGCYSYGRWVLIKHNNGLSSMYAHLSSSRVSPGQVVAAGEVIGYSGGQPGADGSGYSTGPHLHLGLFASQAVSVRRYESSNFCKQVSIPIAQGLNAYLDPLAYLPPL